MKRSMLLIATALLFLTGCMAGHYYKVENDSAHIYLKKPAAQVIYFASSLDGYEFHEAKKINDTTWRITVPARSEFKYFYIVDGVLYLPECRYRENDDLGSESCIYIPNM